MQETWVRFLGQEDPLEKEMATHSRILAWRIPWTEEPGGLQSMRSQESDTTERLHFHFRLRKKYRGKYCLGSTSGGKVIIIKRQIIKKEVKVLVAQ